MLSVKYKIPEENIQGIMHGFVLVNHEQQKEPQTTKKDPFRGKICWFSQNKNLNKEKGMHILFIFNLKRLIRRNFQINIVLNRIKPLK